MQVHTRRPNRCSFPFYQLARAWPHLALALVLCAAAPARANDAVEPGAVYLRPTWGCMGINWHFRGDANRNASVRVAFRRIGTDTWREAMPLWQHRFEDRLILSGSVFRLCPGTEYEFRLQLEDPDGGSDTRIARGRTLDYPRMPSRTVRVQEGGLVEAQRRAEPGTVMVLAKGTYSATALTKSGRPGEPIVYRASPDEEVVIEGQMEIRADHVWLHGLTLRDPAKTIEGAGRFNCITNCRLQSHYTIHTPDGAQNWFIADNVMKGDASGRFSFSGEGVDFGSDRGGGHAVCFNDITDFADGISYGGGHIDIYGNCIHETVDDFIEPDYARENYRAWENRCYNSMCGFSFQPQKGGPWYYFGNLNVGTYLHAFKTKRIDGATVIYGNTILSKNPGLGGSRAMLRGEIINNVWMRTTPGALTDAPGWDDAFLPLRVDYNAYSKGSEEVFAGIGYPDLARRFGWDRHSILLDWREPFAETVTEPAGNPRYGQDIHGLPIPKDWLFEHFLLIPKADSALVDAGTVLPNITGPYLGKAPDIGAHEVGLGTAWYGPRAWDDEAGLVYGLPTGWEKVDGRQRTAVTLQSRRQKVTATLRLEEAQGEARWEKVSRAVAGSDGAVTPVLEFQDGLLMRLYVRDGKATLVAARVEPEGVLHAEAACAEEDLAAARVAMFQFARSLYR